MTHTYDAIYHDIIDCLTAALDAKDIYTSGHSTRVADTSCALGSLLGLKERDLECLHIAAHLHDIGKIGVPDHIIHKNGRLTENEWILMKEHTLIGYNILKKADSLKSIAQIILHHHENYNGSGYPHKLKDEEIPFNSRIIAVCDSIDAMLTDRPYRKKLSYNLCKQEIIKNSEIKYDPKIVKCLIEHWYTIVVYYYKQQ